MNNKYDTKCEIHNDQDIKLICSICKVLVCTECIVSDHNGHKFEKMKEDNTKPIFEEFKNNHLQNLEKQLDINKAFLEKSNSFFKSLEDKHNQNIGTIKKGFRELINLLQLIEIDKIKQLETLYDENQYINTNISTTIDYSLFNINFILNKYKDTINQLNFEQIIINSDQHIEISKHCYQSQRLIKENQDENKINHLISQYKNVDIINNSERFRDSIKEIFQIIFKPIDSKKDLKRVTVSGREYFIFKNYGFIPNGTTCVAIPPSVDTIQIESIPTSVKNLILLDGFDVQLTEGMLPQSIEFLLVGAIKKPLLKGSIPNGVKTLILLDGFKQEISEIPQSVCQMYICDIPHTKFPFTRTIFKTSKYKHQLLHPHSLICNAQLNLDIKIIVKE
ncbi:hypothetical protein ACTA71_003257 [Dictyostelium dimigraforme]